MPSPGSHSPRLPCPRPAVSDSDASRKGLLMALLGLPRHRPTAMPARTPRSPRPRPIPAIGKRSSGATRRAPITTMAMIDAFVAFHPRIFPGSAARQRQEVGSVMSFLGVTQRSHAEPAGPIAQLVPGINSNEETTRTQLSCHHQPPRKTKGDHSPGVSSCITPTRQTHGSEQDPIIDIQLYQRYYGPF
jgi:hypothetical protein